MTGRPVIAGVCGAGTATDADVNQFTNVTDGIKQAGAANGLDVQDQIPSAGRLTQRVNG